MDSEMNKLKEFLTDIVSPEQRKSITFNPDHVTVLTDTRKSSKQLYRKQKPNRPKKTLNRRELNELGLNTLATLQIQYEDALSLHRLWCTYARKVLDLKEGLLLPEAHEKKYENFCRSLCKLDLHGAKLKVVESNCPTLLNLEGIVVLERKNIFKIISKDNRIRTLPKSECNFAIRLENAEIIAFGKSFGIRPAERAVKKIKQFPKPLLSQP